VTSLILSRRRLKRGGGKALEKSLMGRTRHDSYPSTLTKKGKDYFESFDDAPDGTLSLKKKDGGRGTGVSRGGQRLKPSIRNVVVDSGLKLHPFSSGGESSKKKDG